MNQNFSAVLFYYGSVIALIILFIFLSDKKKLVYLIPLGLIIAVENFTLEIILLHNKMYIYPLKFPGYPDAVIISSIILFPILGMLYYQYLSDNTYKNIVLTVIFLTFNMVTEIISLKIGLFYYQKYLNLIIVFFMYLFIYIIINLYRHVIKKCIIEGDLK